MRATLQAVFAPDLSAVQFAVKTLLGAGLALWLALRLGLEQPQWALMTAFIIAQPLSGMVLQKGLARLLGTLVGTLMAVLLMGLFAQAPELFLLSVALWLGLCTAASTLWRSAWAYAFVLAGYTVAIIGLPALAQPLSVFDQAVARCTEISLGILCATASSALLWPQPVQRQLAAQAQLAWRAGLAAVQAALGAAPAGRAGLLEVLGRLLAVEVQREHALFEGEQGRQRSGALRQLTADLLGLLRLARGVARQREHLSSTEVMALAPWLEEVRAALTGVSSEAVQALRTRLRQAAQDPAGAPAWSFCLERLALLLHQYLQAEQALQAVRLGRAPVAAPASLSWHRDLQTALVYGTRSTLTFGVLALFWRYSAWPSAGSALLLASVVSSLFASRDNADRIGLSFLRGILYALPVAFLVGQLLLPQWSGFVLLCLGLGVPLFLGSLAMAQPALTATATSFCLHFIVLCAPQQAVHYDVALFFNQALALLIGVGCAVLALRLVVLHHPGWHARRLLRATLEDLRRLTSRPLAGAETWFGGRIADRLLQLARHYPRLPSETRSRWDDGLASLDLGDELLHLRVCLAEAPAPLHEAQVRFWRQLRPVLAAGPGTARSEALQAPVEALLECLRVLPVTARWRLAEAALLQLNHSWRHWCAAQENPHGIA
ncbi:MAG: FUSC family protein [Pseudomonas sp.]|uniref:FUSC family protein n=1 Tax=Pseudomonas sp. TaxID=306 RepID=UPI00339B7B8F